MFGEEGYRRHTRIREDVPVRWRIEKSGRQGEGVIRNLSISGILLESQSLDTSEKNAEFLIETVHGEEAFFVPNRARFVWGRAVRSEKGYYFCGLEFVQPPVDTVHAIEKRVENRLQSMGDGVNLNVLDNYFGLRE